MSHGAFVATVSGRVQGVGFRYYTRSMALRLGVCGYVQNLADGNVLVRAEGNKVALTTFAQWLQKGPPSARVGTVDLRWGQTPTGYASFTVEY